MELSCCFQTAKPRSVGGRRRAGCAFPLDSPGREDGGRVRAPTGGLPCRLPLDTSITRLRAGQPRVAPPSRNSNKPRPFRPSQTIANPPESVPLFRSRRRWRDCASAFLNKACQTGGPRAGGVTRRPRPSLLCKDKKHRDTSRDAIEFVTYLKNMCCHVCFGPVNNVASKLVSQKLLST